MSRKHNKLTGRTVEVKDDNIEKALRKFKKKIESAGVLKDLQDKEFYTPPSITRVRERAAAKKRWQKYLKSQELVPKNY